MNAYLVLFCFGRVYVSVSVLKKSLCLGYKLFFFLLEVTYSCINLSGLRNRMEIVLREYLFNILSSTLSVTVGLGVGLNKKYG